MPLRICERLYNGLTRCGLTVNFSGDNMSLLSGGKVLSNIQKKPGQLYQMMAYLISAIKTDENEPHMLVINIH